ncbi:nucleoside-diphosphate sugar epimerase/dehydratase [Desemzia incerta]|uniref:nucleoside-diphosphate sugar epimerase/dehydratase n=1 Tax=Desemzia incerta TaxID=82801 RepID=UPI00331456CF
MLNRKMKRLILVGFDTFAILMSSILSYIFLEPYVIFEERDFWLALIFSIMFYLFFAMYFHLFFKINRYTSIKESIVHMGAITIAFILASFLSVPFVTSISIRFMLLTYLFSVTIIPGSRIIWRIYHEHQQKIREIAINGEAKQKLRTLVVGGGQGGSLFIKSLQRQGYEIELIGIVDDDPVKQHMTLYGVPVIGRIENIPELVKLHAIEQITVAIPSLSPQELNRIVEICAETDATVNQMPSVEDVVLGKYKINKFKEIEVTDLLGREEVELNMELIAEQLSGQTVLVSGAGGSIGSEICRQIIRFSPQRILLLGHGENSIYLINKELNNMHTDTEVVPIIADIQDKERLLKIMNEYKPDRVYHAAAHKHVPLMEYNPTEAVKNNIYGTKNIAEAAKTANVQSFVMISTDKAVNPPNVMGSTKRIAEMIVTGLNEKGKTNFVAVRFGNVLGSRGSVIPLFKEQMKNGGPITITDFRMTRYFMTIPEASKLVLQAGALADGGEIFVLDMGEPVRILDLARKMIKLSGYTEKEIQIVETGIRPGEKLYEELLASSEHTDHKVYDKIFVGKVNNESLNEVLKFVRSLEQYNDEEIKTKLVDFANGNHPVNENKVTTNVKDVNKKVVFA